MGPDPDTGAAEFGWADRPLGRGLQDVSHLFLSQPADEAARDPVPDPGWRAERPAPRQESVRGVRLLRPAAQPTREQVVAALRDFEGALEEGMKVIDAELPCATFGPIDLLAIDRAGQLTLIDLEPTASDDILIRGLVHFDWVLQELPNVRRMYRGLAINFSRSPRLVLVAPQFSSRVRRVGRRIPAPVIEWVRFRVVDLSGQPGVFFEAASED